MRRLVRTARADEDLIEIGRYIARDNPAAAQRMIERLDGVAHLLSEQPGLGRRDRIASRLDLMSFPAPPYVIFDREIASGIEVVRFLHGRRDLARIL